MNGLVTFLVKKKHTGIGNKVLENKARGKSSFVVGRLFSAEGTFSVFVPIAKVR